MMLRVIAIVLVVFAIGGTARAQEQVPPTPPPAVDLPAPVFVPQAAPPVQTPPPVVSVQPGRQTPPVPVTPAPTPQAKPAREGPPRKVRGRDLNIQVELTISDQIGTAAPEKRIVSMIAADASFGRIRSNASNGLAVLNIDARPELIDNDRILVELTVEYSPAIPEGAQPLKRPAALHEMLSVILQNGKPLLISQAADPLTDRKMTVEVRASIIK
jgi:hypothetical protein